MHNNKSIINKLKPLAYLLISIASVTACIEEFNPVINESGKHLVISGSILKGDSLQVVNISYTKPFTETTYQTVSGCEVWVEDNNGNRFDFTDAGNGKYVSAIPDEYLTYNTMYRLRVNTGSGGEYQSDYDPILESAPVDTIYPLIESYQSSSVYHDIGYQLYIDLKALEGGTKNFRWSIIETFEYRSPYFLFGYWQPNVDSALNIVTRVHPDQSDSLYFCYRTQIVSGVYTASTENLTINEKKKIPLHYIPGNSIMLKHKYSILVKQYALSDAAYEYWYTNRVAISESGGLYQTQPSQSKSNIYNINDPDELVVGFFWASSYTEDRIFLKGSLVKPLEFQTCPFDTIFDFNDVSRFPLNDYLLTGKKLESGDTLWGTTIDPCIDCRMNGGIIIKPEYW